MRNLVLKSLACLCLIAATAAVAQSSDGLQCSQKDEKLIDAVAKQYFEDHSSFTAQDITTSAYFCYEQHASARIKLNPPSTVQAIVYLKKVHQQWKVILLGSAFKQPMLEQIPDELREATGEIDKAI